MIDKLSRTYCSLQQHIPKTSGFRNSYRTAPFYAKPWHWWHQHPIFTSIKAHGVKPRIWARHCGLGRLCLMYLMTIRKSTSTFPFDKGTSWYHHGHTTYLEWHILLAKSTSSSNLKGKWVNYGRKKLFCHICIISFPLAIPFARMDRWL